MRAFSPRPRFPAGALVLVLGGLALLGPATGATERATEEARAAADIEAALADLESPVAATRHEAERSLAVELGPEHQALLVDALRDGGPEARRRIVGLLARDDRHLELAAQLSMEGDDTVAALGAEAVEAMYLAWNPAALDPGLTPGTWPVTWENEATAPLQFDPGSGALWDLLDRIDRFGLGRAPLVVDPNLDPTMMRRRDGDERENGRRGDRRRQRPGRPASVPLAEMGEVRLDWVEAIALVADRHDVQFEVHGYRQDGMRDAEEARVWVRVHTRGATGWNASALVLHWVRGVLKPHEPRWNRAAARALAASEWPAALAWLERRWIASDDPAGLAGVLHAAARGRVVPGLLDRDRVVDLVHTAERWTREGVPGSAVLVQRVAHALARCPAVDVRGRALTGPLLDGIADAVPAGQWMRLVALEGQARPDADVAALAQELLAAPGDPAVRLAALGARLACGAGASAPFDVAAPLVIVQHAASLGRQDEVARALAAIGARPDPRAPLAELVTDAETRLALVEWLALAGEPERAARLLLPAIAAEGLLDPATDRVRLWVGLGHVEAGAALARAIDSLDSVVGERFVLRSGVADAERIEGFLARVEAEPPTTREGWVDLASLAAHVDQGARVREVLLAGLTGADQVPEVLPGLLRAQLELQRGRRPMEASLFSTAIGRRIRSLDTAVPLRSILPSPYVPLQPAPPRRLEALDRRLAP